MRSPRLHTSQGSWDLTPACAWEVLTLQLGQNVFKALHRLGHVAFEPGETKFLAKDEKGEGSELPTDLQASVYVQCPGPPNTSAPKPPLTWTALETPNKLEETQASRRISVQPLLSEFTQ